MKVRVVNDGTGQWFTKVTDAETGEEIKGIKGITIEHLSADTGRDPIVIQLEVEPDYLDIIGEATIMSICPHCHRRLRLEP